MEGSAPRARLTGRDDHIAAVIDRLREGRLVTVTGCGGIGKSTLAREVRVRLEGVSAAWIDLSTIHEGSEVAPLIARTLGIGEQSARPAAAQVERYLVDNPCTLVVDNCEHVVEAVVELVVRLLLHCPGLRVLATSTVRLGLPDEHIYDLPPMDLPGAEQALADVSTNECVRLLVARARQVVPAFEVTENNRAGVVELCQRLDGLPLAIELAAMRLQMLSIPQLLDRLAQRFGVLTGGSRQTPGRHQTLRALMDWSFERCTTEEKCLWGRLAIFRAPFDLEAVERVCGFGGLACERVLDVLTGLVARSLLVVERSGEQIRYRQLATIRDYGAELLSDDAESAEVRRRLLHHHLERTRTMVGAWCGPHQGGALATWRADHATMLAAVAAAVEDPAHHDEAAELVVLLRYHWIAGGQLSDGRRWLERMRDLPGLAPQRRGQVLATHAWVVLIQGDRAAAASSLSEAGAIAKAVGDRALAAQVDTWTGLRLLFSGELLQAIASYQRAMPVLEATDERGLSLTARFQMGMAQALAGQLSEAQATCEAGIAISRAHGERWNLAYSLWVSSLRAWRAHDLDEAVRSGHDALAIQAEFQDGICIALQLLILSWVAEHRQERLRSRRLARAAELVWHLIGTDVGAFGPDLAAEHEQRTPSAIGLNDADAPRTRAQAVAEGLGLSAAAGPTAEEAAGAVDEQLTRREQEILGLLTEGRSNRAISQVLGISNRTVEGHVANILAKLGLSSRAEVSAWAHRRGLPVGVQPVAPRLGPRPRQTGGGIR